MVRISSPFIVVNDVERACNQFAAEFLAPEDQFLQIISGVPRSLRADVFDFVSIISEKCLLSKYATAIRLSEVGEISRIELQRWIGRWNRAPRLEKEEEKSLDDRVNFNVSHAKRVAEISYFASFISSMAIDNGLTDSLEVQEAIGLPEQLQAKAFALASRRMTAALKK